MRPVLMAIEAIEPDGVLVQDHLGGADGAFDILYRRYHPRLVRLCLRSTRDLAAAEDAAQETLVRALVHLHRFDTGRPLWPWLRTIATRLLIDHAKDRARELPVDDPDDGAEVLDLDSAHERPILVEALSNLPPRQRIAVALRFLEDWDHERAARFMDLSGSAFRQILYRGRHKLREEYRRLTEGFTGLVLAPFAWVRRLRRGAARARDAAGGGGAATAASSVAFHVATGVVAVLVTAGSVVSATSGSHPEGVDGRRVAAASAPAEREAPAKDGGADAPRDSGGGEGPAAVASGRMQKARSAVDDVTDPNRDVQQPEDATILSIAHSPNFSRDPTVFAAGQVACRVPQCPPVLFRSQDAGATWDRLEARGLRGTQVLLPPAYGRGDQRIFAFGPLGIQVSEDDGRTFASPIPPSTTPGAESAVISPAFNESDPRIVIGGQTLTEYRDDTRVFGPAEAIPGRGPLYPAFSPSPASDGLLLVGGVGFDEGQGGWVSTVFRCEGDVCSGTALGPGTSPQVRIAPDAERSGVVYAFTEWSLFRSEDRNDAFGPVALPAEVLVRDLAMAEGRILLAAGRPGQEETPGGGIYGSEDRGESWERVPSPLVGDARYIRTSGSHVLVALGGAGIACSSDAGSTWGRRCAP